MNVSNLLENLIFKVTSFFPGIIGTLIILIIGWFIAKFVKKISYKLLKKTTWDDKLMEKAKMKIDINKFISNLLYVIIMIYVLLIVLQKLGMTSVLEPLQAMMSSFLLFLPKILGAGIIFFIGYLIAKFVSSLVNLLGDVIDKLLHKINFKETDKIISILEKLVFVIIIVPFTIAALNKIELKEVSGPVNHILEEIIAIIPNILGAIVIITIFVVGGNFIKSLLKGFLDSVGVDKLAEKMQLSSVVGNNSLSKVISNLVFFFLVFFGVITGVEMLKFAELTNVLNTVLATSGQILFGMVILVVGNFVATIAYKSLSKSDDNKSIASIVKYAILGLFLAMALTKMGFADDIVKLAFGLILGAIAVVIALSYGLGGREAAGEHMKEIIKKFKK